MNFNLEKVVTQDNEVHLKETNQTASSLEDVVVTSSSQVLSLNPLDLIQ